jgi:glycolate oxidase iron-sulfur subunit
MEQARARRRAASPGSAPARLLRWLAFAQLLPRPARLRRLAQLLRWYQRSPVRLLLHRSGLLSRLSGRLDQAEALLPRLPGRFFQPAATHFPARGSARFRVALFIGCVMPYLYPEVHEATIRVLTLNGCHVVVPPGQRCCGALHLHSGEPELARRLARQNASAFLQAGVDAVIVNAAGCGAALKGYRDLLAGTAADRVLAGDFASRVKDVNEFLSSMDLEPPSLPLPLRVTLQESCHLTHAQRVKDAPRKLLALIPALELVEMAQPDLCCGSAGVYNLLHPDLSNAILDAKMKDIQQLQIDTIVTANPGCLLQLAQGVRRHGLRVNVRHVIQLLDASYGQVPDHVPALTTQR